MFSPSCFTKNLFSENFHFNYLKLPVNSNVCKYFGKSENLKQKNYFEIGVISGVRCFPSCAIKIQNKISRNYNLRKNFEAQKLFNKSLPKKHLKRTRNKKYDQRLRFNK